MNFKRTTGVAAAAIAVLAVCATTVSAQTPTVTWQQLSATALRVDWSAVPQATSYEIFVSGPTTGGTVGPIPVGTTFFVVDPVPAGNYVLAVRGRSGNVVGPLSNPVTITMGPIGGCSIGTPTVTVSTAGSVVNVNWNAVAGAVGYRLQLGTSPGATQLSVDVPASQTSYSANIPALGTFYLRVIAGSACGATANSPDQPFTISSPTPGPPVGGPGSGPRTPDPAPGQILPLPGYAAQVVRDMANAYRGDLFNSCVEHGGNNTFMFRVVNALRQRDSRWGLNWKRGNRGDLSQDIVTYNFGPGPDEDTTNVYIIDMIGGHCGNSPSWNWEDVTQKTRDGGAIGRWTLQPYLRAGLPADPQQ